MEHIHDSAVFLTTKAPFESSKAIFGAIRHLPLSILLKSRTFFFLFFHVTLFVHKRRHFLWCICLFWLHSFLSQRTVHQSFASFRLECMEYRVGFHGKISYLHLQPTHSEHTLLWTAISSACAPAASVCSCLSEPTMKKMKRMDLPVVSGKTL